MLIKAKLGFAVVLVTASAALAGAMAATAQQHPWMPGSVAAPTGNLPHDELYNSCNSSHPVFSCPGA
jgi:hypothetical protein